LSSSCTSQSSVIHILFFLSLVHIFYSFLKLLENYFFNLLIFIYSHVHTLFGSLLPIPSLSPNPCSLPGRICLALIFNFVGDKTKAIQRQSVFAGWGKDSYTERFLALLPCTNVLHLKLIHLLLTFSLVLDPLLMLSSVTLRFLY
jgi:hypothetical protein